MLPDPPPPPKGDGCGGIGTALMIVVAVVVTIYTAGAAASSLASGATFSTSAGVATVGSASTFSTGLATLSGGLVGAGGASVLGATIGSAAIGAAAGSIASQLTGLATGVIDQFSWKAVGQAALSGGITAGMGNVLNSLGSTAGTLGGAVNQKGWAGAAIRAGLGAAVSQAMQGRWSWREVAASTVAGAAGHAAGEAIGSAFAAGGHETLGKIAGQALGAAAGGWASSQILGYSGEQTRARMGQAFISGLAGGIGNAMGDSIAQSSRPETQGVGPYSAADYRNGSNIESDNYTAARQAEQQMLANNRTALNAANVAADPAYYSSPTPEQLQAAFRQSERDYRSATERSVAGSGYVARSGDNISRMLGTSSPQAIGNFMRANGLTSSSIEAGRNYFIPDDVGAYGDAAALGQAVLNGDNRRLAALARERFNFSDGRDARDIRLSFGYQSRVSRELSDLGAASSFSYGGSSGSIGEIRAMSATEGFFTFNPVGRFMKGWGHSATEILKSPYTLGREAVFMVGDAVGNGTYAAMNWAFGGNQSYQNDSALGRSLETNGVLGTIGLATKGAVLSLPGIAQIDAINRRDWGALGESGPGTLLVAAGLSYRPASTLYNYGDHLRPVLGPATLSHPEEVASILSRAEEMGIGVRYEAGRLAYEPALRSGTPGTLILDPDASIGALRHEWKHAVDNADLGHPGFRLMADSDAFWRLEYRGYMEEIRLARETRNFDAGRKIVGEMRTRRGEILGY
ncbi:hypothetical protein LZ017_13950 [Pelomonas sp. CA6]|uniref:hypothetical protein n=1 Tax=Pelomonas sp. CA6 TaxID=2907999 RepID=UPI001F4C1473|nr:hypothetical protein [Pelomonas sp. CA6]MCH7344482.1 hypothetical protein [Pelomonas sp. CA6]